MRKEWFRELASQTFVFPPTCFIRVIIVFSITYKVNTIAVIKVLEIPLSLRFSTRKTGVFIKIVVYVIITGDNNREGFKKRREGGRIVSTTKLIN